MLYISYNSLIEPLGPTQVLPYVRALAATFDLTVLSYEKPVRTPDEDARDTEATGRLLSADGIEWIRLKYHKWPSVPATVYDIVAGIARGLAEHRRRPFSLLHARGYVSAAVAWGMKGRTRVPFLFDIRGLLADEYADAGIWKKESVAFRLTKAMEQRMLAAADGLVTLTEAIRPVLRGFPGLQRRSSEPPWAVIPTCVNLDHFKFDPAGRARVREVLRIGDRPVLVYSGSVGMWYLLDEMLDFYVAARDRWSGLFFLALVNRAPEVVAEKMKARGVPETDFAVTWVHHQEMPAYLSAADAAIAFIRPSLSKQSSSPTKHAEYLSCGLPFAANAGVGDVDALIEQSGAGALIASHDSAAYAVGADRLRALADTGARDRFRAIAEREFSVSGRAEPAYRDLYTRILEAQPA